jgi:hypothetical protein
MPAIFMSVAFSYRRHSDWYSHNPFLQEEVFGFQVSGKCYLA